MKKKLRISTVNHRETDWEYWKSKSYKDRLEAIELLRNQFFKFKNVTQGLQRICRVITKA